MSSYQEMCETAETERKGFLEQRDRCWGYLFSIVSGLLDHCGVPQDQLAYLKWNGLHGTARRYVDAGDDGEYTLPGATDYDTEDGCWHLGVRIGLTPHNTFPKQYVAFVICVSEQNNFPVVKIGINEKLKHVHLSSEGARNLFCDGLVQQAVKAIANRNTRVSRTIGFEVTEVGQS
jgi:hypothetical protein